MSTTALFLLYALLAASLDNLGQGFQKGGSAWMEEGPKGLLKGRGWFPMLQWVTGIVMCVLAPFVLAWSLSLGPATFAAALGVFGLVPLYLYAHFVLKEKITSWHAGALVLVVAGTSYIGWMSSAMEFPESQFQAHRLAVILLTSVGVSSALCLWAWIVKSPYLGFAFGAMSGIVGGLNLLVLKWGALAKAWWTTGGVWIGLAILAFFVLQVAYRHSTALQVVPSNTAVAVLFPMLVSPVLFAEPLPTWLVVGSIPSFLAIGLLAHGEKLTAAQAEQSHAPHSHTGG